MASQLLAEAGGEEYTRAIIYLNETKSIAEQAAVVEATQMQIIIHILMQDLEIQQDQV